MDMSWNGITNEAQRKEGRTKEGFGAQPVAGTGRGLTKGGNLAKQLPCEKAADQSGAIGHRRSSKYLRQRTADGQNLQRVRAVAQATREDGGEVATPEAILSKQAIDAEDDRNREAAEERRQSNEESVTGPRLAGSSTDRVIHVAAAIQGVAAQPALMTSVRRRIRRKIWNAAEKDDGAATTKKWAGKGPMTQSEATRRTEGTGGTEPETSEAMADRADVTQHGEEGRSMPGSEKKKRRQVRMRPSLQTVRS